MNKTSDQNIEFVDVFKEKSHHSEVMAFWDEVVPHAKFDRQDRAQHLVTVAKHQNQIIGVTTAQPKVIPMLNKNSFYNFRMLIHPSHRIPGLVDKLSLLTIQRLEEEFQAGNSACIGIITLVENMALNQYRREPVYPTTGFVFIGFSKKGFQIRVKYFKGASI
ncbi:MAG: hypothetical protein ABJH05_00410 [Fulvivirga sp.]